MKGFCAVKLRENNQEVHRKWESTQMYVLAFFTTMQYVKTISWRIAIEEAALIVINTWVA